MIGLVIRDELFLMTHVRRIICKNEEIAQILKCSAMLNRDVNARHYFRFYLLYFYYSIIPFDTRRTKKERTNIVVRYSTGVVSAIV